MKEQDKKQDKKGNTMNTPWGSSQTVREMANGITSVSTAGHGGFMLSPERQKVAREMFPNFTPFTGNWKWLEEDCDVIIAVLAFPGDFRKEQVQRAVEYARKSNYFIRIATRRPPGFNRGDESSPYGNC